jgi:hypothetical protein
MSRVLGTLRMSVVLDLLLETTSGEAPVRVAPRPRERWHSRNNRRPQDGRHWNE